MRKSEFDNRLLNCQLNLSSLGISCGNKAGLLFDLLEHAAYFRREYPLTDADREYLAAFGHALQQVQSMAPEAERLLRIAYNQGWDYGKKAQDQYQKKVNNVLSK